MALSGKQNLFYDLGVIKDLPILSVAEQMGIDVQKQGKNYWCKIRDEKDPSVILHPDTNHFYDFGNQEHGDVIRFVQYAKNSSPGEAIRYLGQTFGLEPTVTRQQLIDRPLTNREYSRIGLHGDLATKNFTFPIETETIDELSDISWYYRISLNELKEQHPEVYRDLIQNKAVPFVEYLRNKYFLDVWNYFHLAYAMGDNSIKLYRSEKVHERFKNDTKALNAAERVLYRACRNADLEPPEPLQHDPVNVIKQLLHGSLTISLGNASEQWLYKQAQVLGCNICQSTLPFYSYFDDRLQNFSHAAQYRAGEVIIQYLSSDESEIRPLLEEFRRLPNRPLEAQIQKATQRKQEKKAPEKNIPNRHEIF